MPNQLTGYDPANPPSGKGGRAREATTMSNVDKMAGGGTPSPAPAHPAATAAAKVAPKPSSFAPTSVPGNSVRVYGSPIEGNGPSQ